MEANRQRHQRTSALTVKGFTIWCLNSLHHRTCRSFVLADAVNMQYSQSTAKRTRDFFEMIVRYIYVHLLLSLLLIKNSGQVFHTYGLIEAVVCLLAANSRSNNCLLARSTDGRIVRLCIISSCQSAATFKTITSLAYRVFRRSSKRPALARVFWIHLLEVCWTFAGSCEHPIR